MEKGEQRRGETRKRSVANNRPHARPRRDRPSSPIRLLWERRVNHRRWDQADDERSRREQPESVPGTENRQLVHRVDEPRFISRRSARRGAGPPLSLEILTVASSLSLSLSSLAKKWKFGDEKKESVNCSLLAFIVFFFFSCSFGGNRGD